MTGADLRDLIIATPANEEQDELLNAIGRVLAIAERWSLAFSKWPQKKYVGRDGMELQMELKNAADGCVDILRRRVKGAGAGDTPRLVEGWLD